MYQVVLADDEALIREGVSENIQWEELGFKLAACCENGKEAAAYVKEHEVDVVLTDICMPYMDGLELSEFLYGEYPQIQIVILSGYDEFDYAVRALKYHVSEYLLKPVTATELSEVLTGIRKKLDEAKQKQEHIGMLNSTWHKTRMLVRSNVLLSLIQGDKSEEDNRRDMEAVGICLDACEYRVAIIEMSMYGNLHNLDEKQIQDRALMAFVVYNVTHEIVENCQAGEVCQGKAYRTLVLFTIRRPNEFKQTIRHITDEITRHLKSIMNLEVTIGLGGSVREMRRLYQSYEEAEQALHFRYTLGSREPVIDLEEVRAKQAAVQTPERIDMEELLLGIRCGDLDAVAAYMEKIKNKMQEAILSKERICLYFQQMAEETKQLLKISDMEEEPVYCKKERVITDMLGADSLENAADIIEGYLEEAAVMLDNHRNVGGKRYGTLAVDYIEKHYAQSDMNLNSVCSYLNISASRFSAIFKKVTGLTFMEALTRTRMDKAKELLKNTDLKNYEIAEKVGFSDPHYFSVAFKKATGQTPTEYAREIGRSS